MIKHTQNQLSESTKQGLKKHFGSPDLKEAFGGDALPRADALPPVATGGNRFGGAIDPDSIDTHPKNCVYGGKVDPNCMKNYGWCLLEGETNVWMPCNDTGPGSHCGWWYHPQCVDNPACEEWTRVNC